MAEPLPPRKILFVEDEAAIFEPFSKALRRNGYEPVIAQTAAEALELADRFDPDLVLLDLNLPDGDGSDVCRTLRKSSEVPIVMLTARGTEMDRVLGLELGRRRLRGQAVQLARADLSDPRRAAPGAGNLRRRPRDRSRSASFGSTRRSRSVELAGERVDVTRKEFDLLAELMAHPGQVVTREDLMSRVWDVNWFGSTKTLDVHVRTLRQKLGDDSANPRFIETVRGVGFRLIEPESVS